MIKFENKIIILLILVLIGLGLSSCGVKKINTESDPPTLIDSIGKMEGIGMALGCMFAPNQCSDIVEKNKTDKK